MELKNILTQKKLSLVYKIGIFLILTLPLISAPPYFHPADWGKSIAFRIIFSAIFFLFAWEMVLYPEKRKEVFLFIKSSKLAWIMLLLILAFMLATVFSLDPFFSFWGSPYRGDGSLNFALYILFGLFCFLKIKNNDWQKFWDFSLLIGVLVSLVGIAQKFGILGSLVKAYGEPVSTMGSSSILALYMAMLSFMALSFAIKEKNKKSFFYYFSFIAYILTINFTSSRSAFLGIMLASLFFILFYKNTNTNKENRFKNKVFWLKISILCLLLFGIIGTVFLIGNPKTLEKMGANFLGRNIYRVVNTVKTIYDTGNIFPDTRVSGWQIAVKAIPERPVLGWGPENFSIAFDKNYSPEYNKFGKLLWWDKPHNFLLETAINAGVFALIIHILLIVFSFWSLQKEKSKNPEYYIVFHGIQSSFIAYTITNFFGFDGASTFMTFFFIIGFTCFLTKKESPALNEIKNFEKEKKYIKSAFIASGLLLFYFLWTFNLYPFLINKEINWADFYVGQQNYQAVVNKMEKVMATRSIIDCYAKLKYATMINDFPKSDANRAYLSERTIKILREAVKIRPYYTRSWYYLGTSLYSLAKLDEQSKLGNDEQLKNESKLVFDKAKQLCPNCENIYYSSIRSLLWSGKYEEAKKESEKCVEMFPNLEDCVYLKGLSKIYLNDLKGGKEDFEATRKRGYPLLGYGSQQEILGGYIAIKDKNSTKEYYQDLANIYETLIKDNAAPYQYHASLAFVYAKLGRFKEAREEALLVIKIDPKLKPSVDEFLKTLPN